MLKKEINKLIRRFLNNKVLKLNSILNKVFKVVILVIIKDLTKIVSDCFVNRIILKKFKNFYNYNFI